jgi:hypothetical protein
LVALNCRGHGGTDKTLEPFQPRTIVLPPLKVVEPDRKRKISLSFVFGARLTFHFLCVASQVNQRYHLPIELFRSRIARWR